MSADKKQSVPREERPWQKELDEIKHRSQLAGEMGGKENVARQHARGKLAARERIARLADSNSFREIGGLAGSARYDGNKLAEFMPSSSIIGRCNLNGRRVVISTDDCTVRDGATGTNSDYKTGYAQKLALEWQLPCIRLLDTVGGSTLELARAGRVYLADADAADEALRLLATVPVVSAVMGPVSGLHAVESCLCHFSVMVKDTSSASLVNPSAGSATLPVSSGVIDNLARTEEEAFDMVRRFLGYLPENVWQMPPRIESADDSNRRDEELLSIVPEARNRLYDPRPIAKHVFDHNSFFEIAPHYGKACITGLARVKGYPVGVMIKNPISPTVAAMDSSAGEKVSRFMQLCDVFHLPIVYFVDEPGFMVGLEEQKKGIVRGGARLVLAGIQTRVPWISFITRQLYGVAGTIFVRATGMYKHYAWVTANWGGMHIEGGTAAAYRRDIESAPDPEAKRKEIEDYLRVLSSTFRSLEAFEIEDMIDPRDTRPLLCDFIEDAQRVLRTQLAPRTGPIYHS